MLEKQTITEQPDKSCHEVCLESQEAWRRRRLQLCSDLGIFSEEVPLELLPEGCLRAFKAGKVRQVEGIAKVRFSFVKN